MGFQVVDNLPLHNPADTTQGQTMGFKKCSLMFLLGASLLSSGCAVLLLGAGVAGGYAISKDSVRNLFDLPKEHVFDKSLAVAKEMGTVNLEDPIHGLIKMEVRDVNVTITVRQVTKKTVELKVQARNDFLMPKVDTAQEIYSKIIEGL